MPKKNVDFPDLSNWGINVESLLGLSRPWQKFYARLPDVSKDTSEWKESHLLSYFMKKYYERCGFAYALAFQGPPCNCQEIVILKKLSAMLSTTNFDILKEYVDWVFVNKVDDKITVKKIGYLLIGGFQAEFLSERKKKSKIDKSTPLPEMYAKLATESDVPIETYGDLKRMIQILDTQENKDDMKEYQEFKKKLQQYCFDFDVLKGIK